MYKCNIFPDKEKAKELLRAEIGRQYCNKFFYLEFIKREGTRRTKATESGFGTAKANSLNIL